MLNIRSHLRRARAVSLALLLALIGPAGALAQGSTPLGPASTTIVVTALRVQTPAYQLDSRGLRVSGYGTNSIPGAPALPVWSTVVELPATGEPVVTVETGAVVLLSHKPALPAAPVPQPADPGALGWSGDVDLPTAVPTLDRPDPAIYAADAFYPAALVEAGAAGWQGGRRWLPLRVFPFQYNPVAGALRYYPDVRVTISVERDASAPTAGQRDASAPTAGQRDASAPTAGLSMTVNAAALPQAAGGSLRVRTGARGLHRLTWTDLVTAGVPVTTTSPATFAVSYLGQPVDIRVSDKNANGQFEDGDLLLFYAEPYVGRYLTDNVYWFTYGGTGSPAMGTRSVTPTGSEPIVTEITQTLHIENNYDYRSLYHRSKEADHWFDSILYPTAGGPTITRTYDLALDDALTGGGRQVSLTAVVHGGADQGLDPDQSMRIQLNSHDAGLYQWQGSTDITATALLPAGWLDASPNQVSLVAGLDQLPGLAYYWISPDWVELTYPALADADGTDRLYIEAAAPGAHQVQATGFLTSTVSVYDIRAPRHPVQLTTTAASYDGSVYTIAFWDADLAGPTYTLSSEAALLAPTAIEPDTASSWGATGHTADYIAIVHSSLWSAIDPLLAHRADPLRDHLAVAKVDVQDIYDEFSYGRRDPEAIRSFLAYAYANWNAGGTRPQYVLLVGSGTYDYTGVGGGTKPNLIPPYLVDVDPWLGEVPADNRYVSLDGPDDILPEMHVGRIPAQTPAQVAAAVDKILAYEKTSAAGDWQRRVVYVADDCANYADNFNALSDITRLNWLPAFYDDRTVYYGDPAVCPESSYSTVAGMRAGIAAEFNNTAFLLQWFGHGSRYRWGDAGAMFANSQVPDLAANTVWPITFSYTCWTGYFINIFKLAAYNYDDRTLGEALITTPQRGSVADLSPSGQHVGGALVVLNEAITHAIFSDGFDRMGAAVDAGKLVYWSQIPAYPDVIDTSIVFGDPATHLRLLPRISIARGAGNTAILSWKHVSSYTSYQVWRSTRPYFNPGDAGSELRATLTAPFSTTVVFNDTESGVGSVAVNYFYIVRGVGVLPVIADSNRVGDFDFALMPGK